MLGALIDLSTGRLDDAVSTFLLHCGRSDGAPLGEPQMRFLRMLVRHDTLTIDYASRVLNVLKGMSPGLRELELLIPIMFRLALHAGDIECAAQLIDRARIVDERRYVSENGAVAAEISAGRWSSGLDHYLQSGELSGETSFRLLRELRVCLRSQLKVEVPLPSLRAYIDTLRDSERIQCIPSRCHDAASREASPPPRPKPKGTNGARFLAPSQSRGAVRLGR